MRWKYTDILMTGRRTPFFWKIIAYTTAVGGCLLSVGSISGLALMRAEHVSLLWYIRHLTPKVLLGWVLGYVILWIEINIISI